MQGLAQHQGTVPVGLPDQRLLPEPGQIDMSQQQICRSGQRSAVPCPLRASLFDGCHALFVLITQHTPQLALRVANIGAQEPNLLAG